MEIWEIIPGSLYQSGSLGADWRDISTKGIQVVIDLEGSLDPGVPEVPESILYLFWPIVDGPLPDVKILEVVANFGADILEDSRKLLVHCGAGINRSGLVNALIYHFVKKCSGQEAIDAVRLGRPGALTNQNFVDYLSKL